MRHSVYITRHGGPETLQLREEPTQIITPHGLRVRVRASGVNFADLMMRMGLYPEAPKLPFSPGYEIAGIVTEVGPMAQGFQPGDRVVGVCRFGGYTTEIVIEDQQLRKIPPHLSEAEAVAIPVNFITAWIALNEMGRVREGDRVLIQSAAGGVGIAALQMAAQAGAQVTALIGETDRAAKARIARDFGAAETLTYAEWENEAVPALYDLILDSSGGDSLKRNLGRLAPMGRMVSFGAAQLVQGNRRSLFRAGSFFLKTPWIFPLKLMKENKGVFGLNILHLFEPGQSSKLQTVFDRIMEGVAEKKLRVHVGKSFPLAEASAAHTHLQSRRNIGKIVLLS